MSQQGILERGIGQVMLVVLALLIVIGAGVFATTRPAKALGTDITVIGLDLTAWILAPGVAPNAAIPAGLGSESANLTISGGLALQVGSAAGTLYRTPAIGGIVEIVGFFTADVTAGVPLDIVTTTVTLGGINAVAGASTVVSNNTAVAAVIPGATITALAALAPTIVVVAATDSHTFTLFGQGAPGTSAITMSAGGQVGDIQQGVGGAAPSVIFVGPATTITFAAPRTVGFIPVAAGPAVLNPGTARSGSGFSAAAVGIGPPAPIRNHVFYVTTSDTNAQVGLDGIAGNATLSAVTGGATFTVGSSIAAGTGPVRPIVTASEVALAVPAAAGAVAGQHGNLAFGITTVAGTAASGTLTVNLLAFAGGIVSIDFIFTGNAASVTISDAGVGDTVISGGGVGTNPTQGRTITVLDANGNPGSSLAAQITLAQTTAAALDFGVGATVVVATAASAGAPQVSALVAGLLIEVGSTGVYPLGVAGNATVGAATAPGTYEFTVTLTVALVVVDTAVTTTIIGGLPVAGGGTLISVTDKDGNDVTDDPKVGQNGLLTILTGWTTALDTAPPNGSVIGVAAPGAVTSLGVFTAATTTNDLGQITHTFVAGASSGNATLTLTLGTGNVQFVVEIGGTGGGVVDLLDSAEGFDIEAAVGDNVELAVIATANGLPTENAILRAESATDVIPSQSSTNADGEASFFVSSDSAGVVVVVVTAVTEGINELIPVEGVDSITFTITFGATTIQLSTGAVSPSPGGPAAPPPPPVFAGFAGLVIIWWWNGAEWIPFVPDSSVPDALRNVFVVDTFAVIFIVTTGEVNVVL